MGVKWVMKLKPNILLVSNYVNASFSVKDIFWLCGIEAYLFA